MEIEILSVESAESAKVVFASSHGCGWGRWMGNGLPGVGETVHVEFAARRWVVHCRYRIVSGCPAATFRPDETDLVVAGMVELEWDDGSVALRIGDDIVLLDEEDGLPDPVPGETIEFRVVDPQLWPESL